MQDAVIVAVVGRPRQIVFPAVCANCVRPASVRLRIQKVFVVDDEDGDDVPRRIIESFAPYFCQECVAACQKELKPEPWLPLKRILHGWVLWFPIAGSFVGGSWVLGQLFPPPLRAGLVAFFWGTTLWCCYWLWRQSRHLAVRPPISITSAIDFSCDQSELFEPQWRKFTFRNTDYAEHFRHANQKRLWSRRHPAARRAFVLEYWALRIFVAALAVASVFWAADELNIPLWDYIARTFR